MSCVGAGCPTALLTHLLAKLKKNRDHEIVAVDNECHKEMLKRLGMYRQSNRTSISTVPKRCHFLRH